MARESARRGRFLGPDNLVPSERTLALNRYAYANDNPISYVDPSGHFAILSVVVGAVVGAVVGGTVAAVTHHNIWQGMAMGAVTGAFFAVGGWAASASEASWYGGAAIYGAAGAAGGATNAAIFGGNVGRAAAAGAALGLAGYAFAPSGMLHDISWDSSALGSTAFRLAASGATGAAFGATQAAILGGDIRDGAIEGAEAYLIGEAANMAVGHAVGLTSARKLPSFKDGVFVYDAPRDFGGAITFGNVVTGPAAFLARTNRIDSIDDPSGSKVINHEISHTFQDATLGPSYIAAHALSLFIGGIVGTFDRGFLDGSHRYDILEREWIDVPTY